MNIEDATQRPPVALDFLDTTKNTQLISQTSSINKETKPETVSFSKSCELYWQTKGLLNYYQKGMFLGKGDNSNVMFEEFLKKFRKTVEEIVREELRNNNQTSESFKDIFKAMEAIFNILSNHLELLKTEVRDERFMPILHGFMTSYINSVIGIEKNG
jgi:hypothetical protein